MFPWEPDWLMRTGRVELADLRPARWPARPWWWRGGWVTTVYRVHEAGAGSSHVPNLRRRLLRPRRALERWSAPNENHFRLFRDGEVYMSSRDDD